MSNIFKKAGAYLKDRITKKEVSTFIGVALMLAGPMGWIPLEKIALIKAALSAYGLVDPEVGSAAVVSGLGAIATLYKEKKNR